MSRGAQQSKKAEERPMGKMSASFTEALAAKTKK